MPIKSRMGEEHTAPRLPTPTALPLQTSVCPLAEKSAQVKGNLQTTSLPRAEKNKENKMRIKGLPHVSEELELKVNQTVRIGIETKR